MPIIKVVPLRRFPRIKGLFDYVSSFELGLEVGDLVLVPFKKITLPALVMSVSVKSSSLTSLKEVERVLVKKFINQNQVKLICWLAEYAGVSIATVARLAVPFLPNSRFVVNPIAIKERVLRSTIKPINILVGSNIQKIKIARSLISKVIKRKQQVLLLIPEVNQLSIWLRHLKFEYEVVSYTGSDKMTDLRAAWLKVRSGKVQIIVGTRSALWLNFYNLGGIIIDQPENENYYQVDQNPRYNALWLAEKLARYSGAALARLSAAPSLEIWQASRRGYEKWHNLVNNKIKIKIIDLNISQKVVGCKLITQAMKERVGKTLILGQKVLFYLNRRGAATSSICRDCGYTAVCAKCQRSLVQTDDKNYLICFHCANQQPLAIPCPKCGGTEINYGGAGLSELAGEIKNIWPDKKIVVLQDKISDAKINLAEKADIIIGSMTAWRAAQQVNLGLVALPKIDWQLNLPEFRSVERTWQLIKNFMNHTQGIIIQTYEPQHYVWRSLTNNNLDYFYKKELQLRKKFFYPPYIKLLRFGFKSAVKDKALNSACQVKKALLNKLPNSAEIIGPYQNYYQLKDYKWVYYLLFKLPIEYNPSVLWPDLREDIIIEPEPLIILS